MEDFAGLFSNPQSQRKANFWKHNEQVPKSPWIITDKKGANTFPFYNLPPEPEKHLEKEFLCAFVLFLLDKIKDGGDSYRDILRKQMQTRTSIPKQSVLIPTDHRTGDSAGDL